MPRATDAAGVRADAAGVGVGWRPWSIRESSTRGIRSSNGCARICLALPEAVEVEAWGRPTFRAAKPIFVHVRARPPSNPLSIVVKTDPEEHLALDAGRPLLRRALLRPRTGGSASTSTRPTPIGTCSPR